MKSWWRHPRIGLIALAPATAAVLVLSTWHAHGRAQDIEDQALAHARTLAHQFAAVTAPDVAAGNRGRLTSTLRALREHYPAIVAATIAGRDGGPLARTGSGARAQAAPASDEARVIEQPIAPRPRVTTGTEPKPDTRLGKLVLTVDLATIRSQQSAVVLESAGIAGLMLLLATLLAVPVHRGAGAILRPLASLRASGRRGRGAVADEPATTAGLRSKLARLERRNARLERARRAAEADSARKSRYLADVSHEIRAPMNIIVGMTELLATEEDRQRRGDYFDTMRASARNLINLLNGVLDVSKAEAGQMQLDYRDVDLNAQLAEVFHLFAPQAFSKGVDLLVVPLPARQACVRADAMRLKQVLINLVGNAVRFTDEGHIRVAAEPVTGIEDQRIRFTVEDTGYGIPADVQPRLFEAFTQGPRAGGEPAPAPDPGAGLGLSIASKLVALMGSRIELRSNVGEGSRFSFALALEPAHAPTPVAEPGPRRRVALIDPRSVTREAHLALLAGAGIDAQPTTADDAVAAAEQVRNCDAIIVHLPASASARGSLPPVDARLAATGIPVLALMHEDGGRSRHGLVQAGYTDAIGKTGDTAALRHALERALGGMPEAPPPASGRARTVTGRRLLIIDDCPISREIMQEYVRAAGYEAWTAGDGDQARHHAAAERFDAILVDLRLPGRDGAATARTLREGDGPNTRTPILAVTADACAEQADRARCAGVDEVLIKPVTREALLERLAEWIPARPEKPSAPDPSAPDPSIPDPSASNPARPDRSTPACSAEDEGQPVIDPGEATRRAAGKPDLARELFDALCRSLPRTRRILARARAEGDAATARAEAHRLRGAVLYCGVPRLEVAVTRLDEAARSGDAQELDEAFACIIACIDEVCAHADETFDAGVIPHAGDACASR